MKCSILFVCCLSLSPQSPLERAGMHLTSSNWILIVEMLWSESTIDISMLHSLSHSLAPTATAVASMRFHNVSRPDTIAPCHRQLSFEIRNHLGSNFHVINFHLNGVCSYESTTSKLHTAASLLTAASTRTFFSCFVSEALNCSPQHTLYWVKENGELKA